MKKYIFPLFVGGLLLSSCGEETESKDKEQAEKSDKKKVENCIYSYNAAKSELNWTAYKFLNKTGVDGSFKTVNVKGGESAADVRSLISSLSFSIPINSLETNDQSRNKKIVDFFFGNLTNSDLLTGEVVSLNDDGKAIISIEMNDIKREVEGDYILNNETFTYQTEIDVMDWNASAGIENLNEECKDLHTDVQNNDTESKLWSDVTIAFKTTLDKTCD